jgi:phospholipase C
MKFYFNNGKTRRTDIHGNIWTSNNLVEVDAFDQTDAINFIEARFGKTWGTCTSEPLYDIIHKLKTPRCIS